MPAGSTWGQYLGFMTAAIGSMFLGSQAVHLYYRPMDDMNEVINEIRRVKQKQLKMELENDKELTAKAEVITTVSEGDASDHALAAANAAACLARSQLSVNEGAAHVAAPAKEEIVTSVNAENTVVRVVEGESAPES